MKTSKKIIDISARSRKIKIKQSMQINKVSPTKLLKSIGLANVYYSYPDCKVTDEMLVILFNFYNFAGTPQAENHKEKLQSLLKQ